MSTYYTLRDHDDSPAKDGPERQLWQAVIVNAVIDALMVKDTPRREEARQWINDTRSTTFPMICEFAGWNPNYLREQTRQMIDAGNLFKTAPKLNRATFVPEDDNEANNEEEEELA